MKKVMYIGKEDNMKIFVTVKYTDGNFSLTGVVKPTANGNADSSGQIDPICRNIDYADGWNSRKIAKLNQIWEMYHLNDMQKGTTLQTKLVNDYLVNHRYDYDMVCDYLEENDFLYDDSYKYGSEWLYIPVPNEIIEWFEQFTDETDMLPEIWQ